MQTNSSIRITGLSPLSDTQNRILILGTMPSVESLRRQAYYGHPRNLFWKLIGVVTGEAAPALYEERKKYLLRHGISLWDMCAVCIRPGSIDSAITDEIPNDIRAFVASHPGIRVIACNGDKAAKLFQKHVGNIDGVDLLTLPSSSPANAGITWDIKMEKWNKLKSY